LIAANLLLGLFGFYFAKAEGGTVNLVWQGVSLEAWLGLAIQVGLLWVVVKGIIRSVPRWRVSDWMRRMAYGWWGAAAFHTAIASSGRFSDFLDAVVSSGMVAIVFAMFTVVWLALLWHLKPPENGEDRFISRR
ncbi:MAG: hypothetical protein N2045_14435, partial [Fimbriimonadales bacterium]|nr:hypothetical protein [Fimbriimonadales bacterium]